MKSPLLITAILCQLITIRAFLEIPVNPSGRQQRRPTPQLLIPFPPSGVVPWARCFQSDTVLRAKLWDRLGIEEDEEPMWYILNCVAGLELDLLEQCREACGNHPDVVKFIVPTVKKTRSHGPNRMVTETKVKYLGYVFAKLRLCAEVYERIQELDMCRSWMGTINHKGYKKLPPSPLALNEQEVKKFGLEDWEDEDEEDSSTDESGVIVDTSDEENTKSKVDEVAIKAFLGLKVEDMVKVTKPGKFYNEDGIVRRLKEGKILVRFYTYGTMYEEWLEPSDVRKLTELELLRGLSGPTQPITQRELDGEPKRDFSETDRPSDIRRGLGGDNQRNRRQDRVVSRFNSRDGNSDERYRNERNWNQFQEQQQGRHQEALPRTAFEKDRDIRAGSMRDNRFNSDLALGDVDSQWGRNNRKAQLPKVDNRRGNLENNPRRGNLDNRRTEAAINGDDWSAFVSPVPAPLSKDDKDADDFFTSLMSDLSKDLDSSKRQSTRSPQTSKDGARSASQLDENFFDSLMTELSNEAPKSVLPSQNARDFPPPSKKTSKLSDQRRENRVDDLAVRASTLKQRPVKQPLATSKDQDEDFFAALEAELGNALGKSSSSSIGTDDATADFFSQLQAELAPALDTSDRAVDDNRNTETSRSVRKSRKKDPEVEVNGVDTVEAADDVPAKPTVKKSKSSKAPTVSSKATTAAAANANNLEKYTVPALKDMLRERGLKVTGKKSELIDRLIQQP